MWALLVDCSGLYSNVVSDVRFHFLGGIGHQMFFHHENTFTAYSDIEFTNS